MLTKNLALLSFVSGFLVKKPLVDLEPCEAGLSHDSLALSSIEFSSSHPEHMVQNIHLIFIFLQTVIFFVAVGFGVSFSHTFARDDWELIMDAL